MRRIFVNNLDSNPAFFHTSDGACALVRKLGAFYVEPIGSSFKFECTSYTLAVPWESTSV